MWHVFLLLTDASRIIWIQMSIWISCRHFTGFSLVLHHFDFAVRDPQHLSQVDPAAPFDVPKLGETFGKVTLRTHWSSELQKKTTPMIMVYWEQLNGFLMLKSATIQWDFGRSGENSVVIRSKSPQGHPSGWSEWLVFWGFVWGSGLGQQAPLLLVYNSRIAAHDGSVCEW